MGILKDLFGDNRVTTAKNPEIQEMMDYMYGTYGAFIEELRAYGSSNYVIRCTGKKYSDLLFKRGMYHNANVVVPVGNGELFDTKLEAYEGLVWLYNFFEEKEENKRKDEEWF